MGSKPRRCPTTRNTTVERSNSSEESNTAEMAPLITDSRIRRRTTPQPRRRVRSNVSSAPVTSGDDGSSFIRQLERTFCTMTTITLFQSAQDILRRSEIDGDALAASFARETMRALCYDMRSRVPSLAEDDEV